jgi:hypothetical protein
MQKPPKKKVSMGTENIYSKQWGIVGNFIPLWQIPLN